MDKQKYLHMFCIVFRHSNIVTNCCGYKYCARCEEELADSATNPWAMKGKVGVGKDRWFAEDIYTVHKLTMLDTLFIPKWIKEKVNELKSVYLKGDSNG